MSHEASGGRKTPSGIPLEPFYDRTAPRGQPPPGQFPYTRGIHPDMYRERLWTMRQYSGFGDPRVTNARFHYLIARGQTGLSVAFDLPTQIGFDSLDPAARGEVGKVGVPVSGVEDLELLFRGIPLDKVSVSMTINSSAAVLLAFLIVCARRQGFDPAALRGTLQNDILKEFVARRTHRFPMGPSMRITVDVLQYCLKHLPRFNPISVSGYHIRESGTTADQELAYTFAHAVAYVEAARRRGLDLEELLPHFSFFFNAQMNLFEEVAKFRAARRMWANMVRHRFGVRSERAQRLRFHAQTAGSALAAVEPENNTVRVTLQALAAVLGGTQSLHTNALDEALGLPTAPNARLALRTQQIIAEESGVAAVVDPLGGCPLVEDLTDKLQERAERRLREIEEQGGATAAIEAGRIQREIEEAAYRLQKEIDSGKHVIVGVNLHRDQETEETDASTEGGDSPGGFRPDPRLEDERIRDLSARMKARDSGNTEALRSTLKAQAEGSENLMVPIIACADGGVTLGEIMATLAEVFGEEGVGN